jgi:PAS domain S-box-containing protein
MIDGDLRKNVHLRIGRQLRKGLTDEHAGDSLFDVVNHLNLSDDLMTGSGELETLAALNLCAGKKAMASAAYEPAWEYLMKGISLLGENPWSERYGLCLSLYTEAAETAFLKGDFTSMEWLASDTLSNIRTLLDGIRIYETRISSDVSRSRLKEAIDTAYDVFEKLGLALPRKVSMTRAFLEFSRTKLKLLWKKDADLLALPDMTDEKSLAILRIATSAISAMYLGGYNLASFVLIMRIINLTLEKGITQETPLWFTYYSIGLSSFSRIEESMKYGRLAMTMMERKRARKVEVRVIHGFNTYNRHWIEPLGNTLPALLEAYQKSFETGNLEFSGFSSFVYFFHGLNSGKDLPSLEREIMIHIEVMRRFGMTTILKYNLLFGQTFRSYMGKSYDPTSISGELFDDETMIEVYAEAQDWFGIFFIYLNRLVLRFVFGDLKGAEADMNQAKRLVRYVPGTYAFVLNYFYRSLIEIVLMDTVYSGKKRRRTLKKIAENQKKLKVWADHAPMNNLHKYHLVEAEMTKINEEFGKAAEFYDMAVKGARDNGFIHDEALACELAARFYIERGQGEIAGIYLKRAHGCWDQWGAKAKVRDMETRYSGLFQTATAGENTARHPVTFTVSSTTGTLSQNLDLETVMKTSLAIAGEIVLDRLLSILMNAAIENAGAQKGFLLLSHDKGLRVEAMVSLDKESGEAAFSPEWLEQFPGIARSIVHYAERTKTEVVLNDAASDSIFVKDGYVAREKPKSVLCMPIIQQGSLSGILYLENNRVTGAFTPDRVEVLKILAAQAAISIRNAQLYEKLNREIAEHAESEAKYRNIFDNAVEGIFQTDTDGKLITANPALAKIFGYDSVEEGFAHLESFASRIYADPLRRDDFIRALTENGVVRDFEFEAKHKDGHTITVTVNANAIKDKDGRIVRLEGMLEDVTEKKRLDDMRIAKEAAETATRSKSEFLATMSHEIRTPMNAILGMAELLAETELTPEQRDYVRTFRSSGEMLLGVINDILDFSKIEAGRVDMESIPLDLEATAESVIKIIAMRAHEKRVEIACCFEEGFMPYRIGDQTRIRQILMNLMGNAIKFTHNGEVILSIGPDHRSKDPDRVLFHVRDTGIGIAKDKLESVFESFSQADSSTTRKYGGTGLGLAITRRLVELMGGDIWADSEPGTGTSFFCSIPMVRTDKIGPEWSMGETLDGIGIILVEPNEALGEIIAGQIRETGALVSSTATLETAAGLFEESIVAGRPAGLLVADLSFTELDEIHPLNAMKRKYPDDMPGVVVLSTGGASKERLAETVPSLSGILTKPVKRIDLQRKILSALGKETRQATASEETKTVKPFPHLRILYAEDIDANRKVVQAFTRGLPLDIVYAENGADALDKFHNGIFDLILMDMEMPVMDGFGAIRAIRDHEQKNGLPPTPVISLTAHAFFEYRQRCLEAGATGFLSKPFRKAELFDVVFGVVESMETDRERPDGSGAAAEILDTTDGRPKEYTASISDIFRDLIPDLFEETGQELETMKKAMDEGDDDTVARLAHGLKGAAGNYELFELSGIFRAVETAHHDGRKEEMRKLMAEAGRFIKTVKIEYLEEE